MITEFGGNIGVVGTGLVGTGWAIVFARAGLKVRAYDESPERRRHVLDDIAVALKAMHSYDLVEDVDAAFANISVVDCLEDAVSGAGYVQESVLEDLTIKTRLAAAIDAATPRSTIIGSSTSGFPASAFTAELAGRERFLVVHPVNPPHLVPVVEIVAAPWTDQGLVPRVRAFMQALGQTPVTLNREIDGFILNRLQGALLDEAWRLFNAGYATAEDIDATVSQGLGLRWSFMGPFETIDLNAPLGIDDYAKRLGGMYQRLAGCRPAEDPWSLDGVQRATAERRATLPIAELLSRQTWRDARLMALRAFHKTMERTD